MQDLMADAYIPLLTLEVAIITSNCTKHRNLNMPLLL